MLKSWSETDLELLKQLAIFQRKAIKQAELYQQAKTQLAEKKKIEAQLQKKLLQQKTLTNFSNQALTITNLDKLMKEAVNLVGKTFQVKFCSIYQLLPHPPNILLRAKISSSKPEKMSKCWLPKNQRKNCITVAIKRKKNWGILVVHLQNNQKLDDDDVKLLQSIAQIIATVVEQQETFGKQRNQEHSQDVQLALRSSEKLHRIILSHISDAVFITDNSGRFTFICPNAQNIFGFSFQEVERLGNINQLLGENLFDVAQLMKSKEITNIEREIIDKYGQQHFLLVNVKQVRIPTKKKNETKLGTILLTCRDITERKQAEEQLRRLNSALEIRVALRTAELQYTTSRLTALMENLNVGVLVKNEQQQVILANLAFCEIFQIQSPPKNLSGRDFSHFSKEYGGLFAQPAEFQQRYQAIDNHREIVCNEEFHLADGRILEADMVPIFVGEKYAGHLWMYRDVTQKNLARAALQESENRLRHLVSTAGTVIIVISENHRILEWNEEAEKIYGWSRDAVLGGDYFLLFLNPDERDKFAIVMTKVLGGEAMRNFENIVVTFDGSERCLSWNLNCLHNAQGEASGVICCGQDLTEQKETEVALRVSEERFRSIFDRAAVGIIQLAMAGEFLLVNDQFVELLQYQRHELPNLTFKEIIYFDDISETLTQMSQLLGGETLTFSMETRLMRSDSSVIWVNLTMSLVSYEDEPKYFIGAINDISDRLAAEEALRESEERFRAIFEQAAVGISICQLDGKFLRVNPKFCEIVGNNRAELLECSCQDITPLKNINNHYMHQLLDNQIENYSLETSYLAQDNSLRWVNLITSLITDEYKEPKYLIYLIEDISERKRAEAALQQSQEFLRHVIDTNPNLIFVKDSQGKFTLANQATADIYGTTVENLIGLRDADFNANLAEVEKFLADDSLVINHLQAHCIAEETVTTATGEVRYFQTTKMPITFNNQTAVLGVSNDITGSKKAQTKLINSLQEKEVLLKEIHHRVKNNLYVISSLLNLQSSYVEDEKIINLFTDSQNRIQSMAMIHEQLYQSQNLAKIDLTEYLQRLLDNLFLSYNNNRRQIKPVIEVVRENLSTYQTADAYEATELLLNLETAIPCGLLINELVTNSFKHAFPDGRGGEISIKLRVAQEKKINLTVADNGIGLPEGLNWEESPSLGLRLVRILTQQLDGEIELLTSSSGTSFHLKFAELNYKERV
ncbi:MAG: PAS domain S-box protein [Gomphosphaeria aponina SAG 52.96 = DSM 107014]|uniref:PAS domain S-box protein n=1 Tax=Gomphosphaeria aponina SAG 52.96 = DSM 107014 TaxID=1521640 RepID=A0A941GSE9_9CHRO|nr:PAS domain S-box protein [Gomphosphaeria aponina SAG 52.96 = DSM 107014]